MPSVLLVCYNKAVGWFQKNKSYEEWCVVWFGVTHDLL